MSFYPKVTTDPSGSTPASPRFPEIEKRVLEYWKRDNTFQASIDQREDNEFVFYDGPPFANGCRTTATCSPATSRTWSPATRPSADTVWNAVSAGTPTGCRPSWRP